MILPNHVHVSRQVLRASFGLAALGGALLAASAWTSPERAWANLLLACFALVGFGLAGLLFLSLHYVTGARWSDALCPIAERLASTVPCTSALLGVVVLGGLGHYPWMREDLAGQATYWFKTAWLAPGAFAARTVAYLAVWSGLAVAVVWASRRYRHADGPLRRRPPAGLSAGYLAAFAITFWLASTDWIMSLEPHWYSTIFGVYHFAGVFLAGLAAITLLAARRRQTGASGLTDDHLHDLGKLLFGFSSFWMYIWFSQYMLIWYANIPEETAYFAGRIAGAWRPVFLLNAGLNWAVPFFVLLPRPAKRDPALLAKVCAVLLAGRWLDLYLMVIPPVALDAPVLGLPELGGLALAAGATGLMVARPARRPGWKPGLQPDILHSPVRHSA